MALTKKQIQYVREELQTCKRPLIFFHDDADGLCSFLLFYRFVQEGKGVIVKTTPKIDSKFVYKVEEYSPDKIFIVDIAVVEQDFLDAVKAPVIWIDHHTPLKRDKVKYFNPRHEDVKDNMPISSVNYMIVQQDMWIAMVGTIADWHWPYFAEDFRKKYPDLLPKEIKDPETALFHSKVGDLVKIMSFCLKGTTSDAMKFTKIFTRIKSPYELLNQETPAARFVYKRYQEVEKGYRQLLDKALKQKPEEKILLFVYLHGNISFTKDIANELLHRNPEKVVIIAREKGDEMKMSLRSRDVNLLPILNNALKEVEGYGGGHEHACGANVKKRDFKEFIESFRKLL